MLSGVMLSGVMLSNISAVSVMMNGSIQYFMLGVVMLNVIKPSVATRMESRLSKPKHSADKYLFLSNISKPY